MSSYIFMSTYILFYKKIISKRRSDYNSCFWFTGAASASKLYTDAIMRLARQSQQGTWGGSADIGKW